MASKKDSGYLGLGFIVSLILAIIPITNIILGIITRVNNKQWIGLILNIILMPIFYIIDLVSIILKRELIVLV